MYVVNELESRKAVYIFFLIFSNSSKVEQTIFCFGAAC